jgi:hypothetical protein
LTVPFVALVAEYGLQEYPEEFPTSFHDALEFVDDVLANSNNKTADGPATDDVSE